MKSSFWQTIKRPIFALAPMANVTDAAFRRIIARHGKPDVMWTEFVSCDGLCSAGRERLLPDFWFTSEERPIVAQIFGATPEHFYACAQLAQELGFDGIDINMGCPDRAVERQGAGAALINNPGLAAAIIRETKRGAGGLPVSVKTRIGYRANTLSTWLPQLLEAEPAAITIHARTRDEMSKAPAHWDAVAEAVEIVDRAYGGPRDASRPVILGNGDIETLDGAEERVRETGADGVMMGRGIFGNPWLFSRRDRPPEVAERLRVLVEHTTLFEELFSGYKGYDVMKKHFKAYVHGFDGAKELRIALMGARNAAEVEKIVKTRYPH